MFVPERPALLMRVQTLLPGGDGQTGGLEGTEPASYCGRFSDGDNPARLAKPSTPMAPVARTSL